jgi:DNA polymerase III subunit beta
MNKAITYRVYAGQTPAKEVQIGGTTASLKNAKEIGRIVVKDTYPNPCYYRVERSDTDETLVTGTRMKSPKGGARWLETKAKMPAPKTWLRPAAVIEQWALKRLLDRVHACQAVGDTRPYLNGVQLFSVSESSDDSALVASATDGHRLARAQQPTNPNLYLREVIVPSATVDDLRRLLADSEAPVQIRVSDSQIHFAFSGLGILADIIPGEFPNCESEILNFEAFASQKGSTAATFNRANLLHVLQAGAVGVAPNKYGAKEVQLILGQTTRLSFRRSENAFDWAKAWAVDAHDFRGPSVEVTYNINYLIDALANVESDMVRFDQHLPRSDVLRIEPLGSDAVYLVQPIRYPTGVRPLS